MMIMIKTNFRTFYNLFEISDFFDSNFFSTIARMIIDSRNMIFFFTRSIFIFVQTTQLKFRKKHEIVIDIFEDERNDVKKYT